MIIDSGKCLIINQYIHLINQISFIEFVTSSRYPSEKLPKKSGQPSSKAVGALQGAKSSPQNKSYPKVKVTGYKEVDTYNMAQHKYVCNFRNL